MEKIFALINQMEADGVIGRCAVGGAVGAIFWLEPMQTKDLDHRHELLEKWRRLEQQYPSIRL